MGLAFMSDSRPVIDEYECREALIDGVTSLIERTIRTAITSRGHASIALSGGSTPVPIYKKLADIDLDWSKVQIVLVDDRWVDLDQPGSNEAMIRETLGANPDALPNIIGLKTSHAHPADGVAELEDRLAALHMPIDLTLMGMGGDAHTASWFPGAEGLEAALNPNNPHILCGIDAKDAPGAQPYRYRISMTLSAVMNSRHIGLLLTGDEKRRVFESAATASVYEAPVKALLAAGPRFTTFWAR